MSKKKRAKPTMAEMVRVIVQLQEAQNGMIEWMKSLQQRLELVDNTFGAYLSMTKVSKKLAKYIDEEIAKQKKEEETGDTKWVSPNDPGDENDAK